ALAAYAFARASITRFFKAPPRCCKSNAPMVSSSTFAFPAGKSSQVNRSSSSPPATPFGWRKRRRADHVHARLQERRFTASAVLGQCLSAYSVCASFLLQLLGGIPGPDRASLERPKLY